jgi:hypothetical protein
MIMPRGYFDVLTGITSDNMNVYTSEFNIISKYVALNNGSYTVGETTLKFNLGDTATIPENSLIENRLNDIIIDTNPEVIRLQQQYDSLLNNVTALNMTAEQMRLIFNAVIPLERT